MRRSPVLRCSKTPLMLDGLVVGGLLFGVAMAIMGKCPGTGPISIAEGRIDVFVGAIGGLVFTLYYEQFTVVMGESLGKMNLASLVEGDATVAVLIFGIALVIVSILIPKLELLDDADLKQLEK
ncbi:YeeE/YedE thiosulfate transporter family protein [Sulfurimonas sp. HSL3-7]|uniref:YeeE/YedE thiosulfate transporter family protein n=1 Tax=Sulfonitrofixus jiaomeiensis TaxID=3131938 RepID=UPI0031F94339